jgi:hypothetical protein
LAWVINAMCSEVATTCGKLIGKTADGAMPQSWQ